MIWSFKFAHSKLGGPLGSHKQNLSIFPNFSKTKSSDACNSINFKPEIEMRGVFQSGK